MSLVLHLSLHVLTALIAGYIIWRFWHFPTSSFFAAFVGAVLIDLDHLIDYFLAFGFHFSLPSFLQGEQFAQSDKIYVLFHGWEYVILLLGIAWFVESSGKLKTIILALALGIFFHILVDVNVNSGMTFRSYSVVYRSLQHYDMETIVTPAHYQEHLSQKSKTTFE
ncbi:MAG: hypothetical protein KBD65_00075 [Candidatus Moranbacteria bacterium]|nr:hypothetical protein [Candidatus Moranbacteria bacterium]